MVTDRRRTPMRALAGGVYDYLYCDADSRTFTPRNRDAPEKTRPAGAAPSAQAATYETRRACIIGRCPSSERAMNEEAVEKTPVAGELPRREWFVTRTCECGGECRFKSGTCWGEGKSMRLWGSRPK